MGVIARLAAGRRSKWVVIAAWLLATAVAIPFQSKLQTLASDESGAFQDRGAESTRVSELIEQRFPGGADTTALVLYTRETPITPQDAERVAADATAVLRPRTHPGRRARDHAGPARVRRAAAAHARRSRPASSPTSQDQTTQFTTVWTSDDATETVVRDVAAMREIAPDPDAEGLRAYVTGEAAFAADQAAALEGIDETLLAVTLALVLVLLLAIYRSPVIALVPLIVVGIAYVVAAAVVYAFAQAGAFRATGQATAILIVLMFGAGTDYCLLLLARYREELIDKEAHAAMGVALRRTGPAIVSAGGIVVVAMLVLAVADYNATRWMGPVLAIGTAVTVLAGITLLPAVLLAIRRVPRAARGGPRLAAHRRARARAARLRSPPRCSSCSSRARSATCATTARSTSPSSSASRRSPSRACGACRRSSSPARPGRSTSSSTPERCSHRRSPASAASSTAPRPTGAGARARVVEADPFVDEIADTIPERRRRSRARRRRATALVGGPSAEIYDSKAALARDARLIVPLALGLVFLIVAVLLRSLIAPLYVIATVVLSFTFALGVSSLIFAESDPGAAAVHVRLPRGARRRLQRLPDHPHPRGRRRPRSRATPSSPASSAPVA